MARTTLLMFVLTILVAADARALPPADARPDRASIRVSVPTPDTKVWFDGAETEQKGTEREFVSPPLAAGRSYTYTVKATWTKDGREITREKQIRVRPGQETAVAFGPEDDVGDAGGLFQPGRAIPAQVGGAKDARARRLLRWHLNFEYDSGEDYAEQLRMLGAILAVPVGEKQYRLYEELSQRPPPARLVSGEDLAKLNRIYWMGDDPEAIQLLFEGLKIPERPKRFWAFFPSELEQDLIKKELAYRGLKEEDIKQTVFKARRRGAKIVVEVANQEGR